MRTRSNVLGIPAAPPSAAQVHFHDRLAYEADCSDLAADIAADISGFVVIDCRAPELYAAGHVPGALNLPHRRITAQALQALPIQDDDLIITYCNGPHCNASTRGALRFSELGRRVKEMPGGMDGWIREELPVEYGHANDSSAEKIA
jgi:rhodanese-related sulfurtransferase